MDYIIKTTIPGAVVDTRLWLYASDCTTLLGFSDDHHFGSLASQITYSPVADGVVHVKVDDHSGSGNCGVYYLSVLEGASKYRLYLPMVAKQRAEGTTGMLGSLRKAGDTLASLDRPFLPTVAKS